MPTFPKFRRRLGPEDGFTLVEALVALTVLAVGSFAAAQALSFGLTASGMSRERLAARSAVDQQMELARALNYDNLVLDDSTALTHATDTTDPDYWVNATDQTFDPDGSGPIGAEPIVRVPGQSPAFHHIQTPIEQGNTTFAIYVYVTWVDSPSDGTGSSDAADGNANGADDSNGHDQKRVTVAVTWRDPVRGITTNTTQSSLFSDGQIPYHKTTVTNSPPSISCPQVTTVNGLQLTFSPVASDTDGTILQMQWRFSDTLGWSSGWQVTGSTNPLTYTFPYTGTFSIESFAVDNGGQSTQTQGCSVAVVDPGDGNGGPDGGTNAIKILSDAAYTNQLSVTLNLSYPNGANGATQMQFSNDGVTWSTKQTVSPSTIWTLVPGDGIKTVRVRYWDSSGLYGKIRSDSITLDQTKPSTPTSLTGSVVSAAGANHTVTLTWGASTDAGSGLAGYRLWRRLTTSTTWSQVACSSGTSCSTTVKASDSYVYYVEAYDLAGNTSAQSNQYTI